MKQKTICPCMNNHVRGQKVRITDDLVLIELLTWNHKKNKKNKIMPTK